MLRVNHTCVIASGNVVMYGLVSVHIECITEAGVSVTFLFKLSSRIHRFVRY